MLCLNKKLFFAFVFLCTSVAIEARPLNVMFVVDYFPSLSQIYILNMITGLIDRGHNVSIFSLRRNYDPIMHPYIKQYKLLNLTMFEKLPSQLPDCDIVFCQFGGLGKIMLETSRLFTWLQRRKLVVCLRGFDMMDYVNNDKYVNARLFEKTDLFLPVCDHFRQRLIALGCPPEKVMVHHSAINCSQFFFTVRQKPRKGPINIVCIGRLVKKKGIPFAIKAIAQVLEKHKNVRLTIVGEGPDHANLELLIKKLKLTEQVKLCGWKSHDEIVDILHQSHIFLLPSVTPSNGNEEGIANALKEAMAMGLISIATWHAGTPELIDHGISGFMVPEKDSIALAAAINHVIEHPEQWQSIALAARKKVEEEFEVKKAMQELENIFYTMLGNAQTEQNEMIESVEEIVFPETIPETEEVYTVQLVSDEGQADVII